jgi:oligosaccharide repeat unit polymerase
LGDRNSFFINAIILIGGYFSLIKSASRKFLFVGVVGALLLYNIIEITRRSDDRSVDAYLNAYKLMQDKEGSSFDITLLGYRFTFDFIPQRHDYFYGKFFLLSITSIVPFLSGQLVSPDDSYIASSTVITYTLNGANSNWGLGSNIVSDLYMDFGAIGVIIFIFIIGRFAVFTQQKFETNNSIKWTTVYLMTLAMFAEISRYGFAFPVRNLVWTFLFFGLFSIKKQKKD